MVIRFFGFGIKEVEEMSMRELDEYVIAMRKIKAQEQVSRLEVAIYPKLKDDKARSKIRKQLTKEMNLGEEKTYMSPKDIARMLKDG